MTTRSSARACAPCWRPTRTWRSSRKRAPPTRPCCARSYKPEVVVMDVRLPDRSGVLACRDIRAAHPDMAVLMLTSFSDDQALFDSIMAGAAGYVLKQIRGGDLVEGIRRVGAGESLLDPAVTCLSLIHI